MLLDEVTINDGGGCPAGFCAAAISVVNSIAGMPSKAIVASWPAACRGDRTNCFCNCTTIPTLLFHAPRSALRTLWGEQNPFVFASIQSSVKGILRINIRQRPNCFEVGVPVRMETYRKSYSARSDQRAGRPVSFPFCKSRSPTSSSSNRKCKSHLSQLNCHGAKMCASVAVPRSAILLPQHS